MQIEFTGRNTTVENHFRTQAQTALDRLEKVLGTSATAHVILTEQKYLRIAEVTVACKVCDNLTAKCEDKDMPQALHDALVKLENQALKIVKKHTTQARHPHANATGSVRLQDGDVPLTA